MPGRIKLACRSVLLCDEADIAARNPEICKIAVSKLRKFTDRVAHAGPAAKIALQSRNRKHGYYLFVRTSRSAAHFVVRNGLSLKLLHCN